MAYCASPHGPGNVIHVGVLLVTGTMVACVILRPLRASSVSVLAEQRLRLWWEAAIRDRRRAGGEVVGVRAERYVDDRVVASLLDCCPSALGSAAVLADPDEERVGLLVEDDNDRLPVSLVILPHGAERVGSRRRLARTSIPNRTSESSTTTGSCPDDCCGTPPWCGQRRRNWRPLQRSEPWPQGYARGLLGSPVWGSARSPT